MHEVQLPQGYRATTRRVLIFPLSSLEHLVLISPNLKDERLSQQWSHSVVLNPEPLDWDPVP